MTEAMALELKQLGFDATVIDPEILQTCWTLGHCFPDQTFTRFPDLRRAVRGRWGGLASISRCKVPSQATSESTFLNSNTWLIQFRRNNFPLLRGSAAFDG